MSYREEANPARAAFLKEFAKVGNKVTWGEMPGEIVRTSDHSVWVRLQHPAGTTPTHRFSQRVNGEYRMHGKGDYSAALEFEGAKEESWRRVSAAAQERKMLAGLVAELRQELAGNPTQHRANRTVVQGTSTYELSRVIPETGKALLEVYYVTGEDQYEVPFFYASETAPAVYSIEDLAGDPGGPAYLVQRAIQGYKGPWVGA
jgi:hypothetical protein